MNWKLRPTPARRRLIKEQERAEDYREWMAARNSEAAKTHPAKDAAQHPTQPAPQQSTKE